MTKCKNCLTDIEQIKGKKERIFCSNKCRIAFNRKILKSEHSNPNTEQIKSEQGNPNKPEPPKIQAGICHGCGRKIIDIKEQYRAWVNSVGNEKDIQSIQSINNICICLPCVQKGITHKGLGLDIKKCEYKAYKAL